MQQTHSIFALSYKCRHQFDFSHRDMRQYHSNAKTQREKKKYERELIVVYYLFIFAIFFISIFLRCHCCHCSSSFTLFHVVSLPFVSTRFDLSHCLFLLILSSAREYVLVL